MKTIWKYPMPVLHRVTHSMPVGAEFLHFEPLSDGVEVFAWFQVNDDEPNKEDRTFQIHGTGHSIPEGQSYLGTTQQKILVWHLYEEVRF